MTKFRITIVETIERIFEDIEIDAPSFEVAERAACAMETDHLIPTSERIADSHCEVDLA